MRRFVGARRGVPARVFSSVLAAFLFSAATSAAQDPNVTIGYQVTKVSGPGGGDRWVFHFKVINDGDRPVKRFEVGARSGTEGTPSTTQPTGWSTIPVGSPSQPGGMVYDSAIGHAVPAHTTQPGFTWEVSHPGAEPPEPAALALIWYDDGTLGFTHVRRVVVQTESQLCEPPEDHGFTRECVPAWGLGYHVWPDTVNGHDCELVADSSEEPLVRPYIARLTTPPLDFSRTSVPRVGFRHRFWAERPAGGRLLWSGDGTDWQPLMIFGGDCDPTAPCAEEGTVVFDLPFLGGLGTAFLRWEFVEEEGFVTAASGPSHWALDDIVVLSDPVGPVVASPPGRVPGFRVEPNPVRGRLTVRFSRPWPRDASFEVFDPRGRRVELFAADRPVEGALFHEWTTRDARGRALPVGVYLVRVTHRGTSQTEKVVVLE